MGACHHIIYSALMGANDVMILARSFTDSRYFSRVMEGSQLSVSYVAGTVSNIMMIALHILMIVLLTRAPIRAYTQIVSGARTLERQQMMSETRQAAGQVPAELRELFADDEDSERTSSGEITLDPRTVARDGERRRNTNVRSSGASPRNGVRGYLDTSEYAEKGYCLPRVRRASLYP